jgi:hypothetical protein
MSKKFTGKMRKNRITKSQGWTIAIDNGWVSYVFELKASDMYSIASLFDKIQNSVQK